MRQQLLSFTFGVMLASLPAGSAFAQQGKISNDVVKIGVLDDMSGLYSDIGGAGAVTAVKMAVEDFGGRVLNNSIEVISADHQNKADIAADTARRWYDVDHVDMITGLDNSATALATVDVARDKHFIVIPNGAATEALTMDQCSPYSVHYTYDTYALAHGTGGAIVKQGGDTWFFLTADYAFGHALEKDTADVVKAAGGKVLGEVRHPLSTTDFSSYILQAQASGAKIIGLANAGGDTINSIKTADQFGIMQSGKQSLAGLLVFITDVNSLGLKTAQGLLLTTAFYWDHDDATRKWSKRFFDRMHKMPTMGQAGDYSATMHYLQAVRAAGTDEPLAVMKKMREMPVNDVLAHQGRIRDDGLMVHDMYLAQVKKPSESKYPWDYYTIKAVIPADKAFRPLSESTCPLVKK